MSFTMDPFMTNNQTGRGMSFEIGWKYSYAGYVSIIMANFIRHLGWSARPLTLTNAPYLVAPTFIDAGIGEYGRCGFVVTKEFGNSWRPGAIATDLPLVSDKPVDFGLQDFCEKCKICADRCPIQAIPTGDRVVVRGVKRWQMDAEKCYSYWNATGYSCGICQVVCPWNHPNNPFHNSVREIGARVPNLRSTIINAEKFFYKYRPGPAPRWMTNSI
jgi:reductive dehalogenase